MKKYIALNELIKEIRQKKLTVWMDRITFFQILLLWIFIIIAIGFLYYWFSGSNAYLLNSNRTITTSIIDSIYFSFITATTTGFGDIIPQGLFRILAIFEVLLGLLLLAIVTSKLVSIKQDVILNELYDLSLNEKIISLRSSLILFKQNVDRIISKIEEGIIKKRELSQLHLLYFSPFEYVLKEVNYLTGKKDKSHFIKKIDPMHIELILGSIIASFEKTMELLDCITIRNIDWHKDLNTIILSSCIELSGSIFNNIKLSKQLFEQKYNELDSERNKIVSKIQGIITPEKPAQSKTILL